MIKKTLILLAILMLATQVGCGRKSIQTTTIDDFGKTVTVTETEHGFWESENAVNHLQFESNRVDKHSENVNAKITAITEQAVNASINAQTPTEKVLINLLAMTHVSHIATSAPPSGIAPPKTAVDMWSTNLIGLGHLALGAYVTFFDDDFRSNNSTQDSPTISNSGAGDVFFMSDNNKNPSYNLTGENSTNFNMDTIFTSTKSVSEDNEYGLF